MEESKKPVYEFLNLENLSHSDYKEINSTIFKYFVEGGFHCTEHSKKGRKLMRDYFGPSDLIYYYADESPEDYSIELKAVSYDESSPKKHIKTIESLINGLKSNKIK